jgi:hypothetical protein
VQLEIVDALRDRRAGAGQEARAHTKRHLAEPQVEARGLDLIVGEFRRRDDTTRIRQRRDHAVGQYSLVVGAEREGHPFRLAERHLDGKAACA